MRDEYVVDASVIGAAFFNEEKSDAAREILSSGWTLIAPDLLTLELASIAATKVWRGEATPRIGSQALKALPDFISVFAQTGTLADEAFALAAEHKFSVYDATYLVLARQRGSRLLTYDIRLMERAAEARLGPLIAK